MAIHDRSEINPKIMLGKPVIKGSRITVELILRKMAEGADEQALLDASPHLTKDDIYAAVRYAADTLCARRSRACSSRVIDAKSCG